MFRKYRGLRRHGFGVVTAMICAILSDMRGQEDDRVTILNISYEV